MKRLTPGAYTLFLIILINLFTGPSKAQESKHHQVWTDISGTIQVAKKLTVSPEVGYRFEPEINLDQVYLRTYFSFRPNRKLKLSAWVAHFNTWKPGYLRTMEIRTSQFVSLYWPQVGGFKFEHRFGLDQRMFYLPGYDLSNHLHRSRFRMTLHAPQFSVLGSARRFYANGSFEVLRNMNHSEQNLWIDHDWITASLGVEINNYLKLEVNMLLINGLETTTKEFEREITVFRLRLKCKLQ